MTADRLKKLQERSKKRHLILLSNASIMVPKEEPKRYADLMAAQLALPRCEPENKEVIPVIKKQQFMNSEFDRPHVPKPVQEKKKIFKSPGVTPDPPKQIWERPKAEYSNSRSPYGIYDELKESWSDKK